MRFKIVVFLVVVFSLCVVSQAVAKDIIIKVDKVDVKFHPDGMLVSQNNDYQCYRLSLITHVTYDNTAGRLSIHMYKGDTVHYDFPSNQKYQGRVFLKRIAEGAFRGWDVKGSSRW